jgi:GNAT superfamily N-acetyltransferase
MWWRRTRSEFTKNQGAGNRSAMKKIVESGEIPGILAYRGGKPVAWCSVAPREAFPSLDRSRVLARLDGEPVWSIVCLFVAKEARGEGLAEKLADAAARHAKKNGARIVEAYPSVPRGKELPSFSSFMGVPSLYERAGFALAKRPSRAKAIMRRAVR